MVRVHPVIFANADRLESAINGRVRLRRRFLRSRPSGWCSLVTSDQRYIARFVRERGGIAAEHRPINDPYR